MTDSHRCLADTKCRNPDLADGTRRGAHTEQPDTLCKPCLAHITNCARQLPKDWTELHNAIGERGSGAAEYVRSTPTPAIPISTTKGALMCEIADVADRAADLISDRLNIPPPTDRRRRPPPFNHSDGQLIEPEHGSVALAAAQTVKPDELQQLNTNINLVYPNIDRLAKIGKQPMLVWDKHHGGEDYGQPPTEWEKIAPGRYTPVNGHGRVVTEMSGLEIVLKIVDVHNRVRAELGKTRLRHKYPIACPAVDKHGQYCGAVTVGKDDGATHVDCKTCGATWTQNEWDFLGELAAEEIIGEYFSDPNQRLEAYRMLRWLLAEAYWRLDKTTNTIHQLEADERVDLPGAGRIILDALKPPLKGHQPPQNRKTA